MVLVPALLSDPSNAAILADKLELALRILELWRLRISEKGRLKSALRLLRCTAETEELPKADRDRLRLVNAIKLAFDLYYITNALTEERVPAIAEDLRRALGGTLDDEGATTAHRAQSQALMAAVMAAGGLRPAAPSTDAGKSPDYVIYVGDLPFCVEIKRPETLSGFEARLADAVCQFEEFGCQGAVLLCDASDCFPTDVDPADETAVSRAFTRIHDDIRRWVIGAGYHRLGLLFVFAHAFRWTTSDKPVPQGIALTYMEVFPSACFGLIYPQFEEIRARVLSGFEALGGQLVAGGKLG